MYKGGGEVWRRDDRYGIVFLEEDWDGSTLPMNLVAEAGLAGSDFEPFDPRERAKLGGYSKIGEKALFLLEPERFPSLLRTGKTEVFLASEWNDWEKARDEECWKLQPEKGDLCLWMNWEDLLHLGVFEFKFITREGRWLDPPDSFPGVKEKIPGAVNFVFDPARTGRDLVGFRVMPAPEATCLDGLLRERPTGSFGYAEEGNGSRFRVYAPRAHQVELLFFDDPDGEATETHPMQRNDDGSWSLELSERSSGCLYRYAVSGPEQASRGSRRVSILDPYALAATGRNGPGIAMPVPKTVASKDAFVPPEMKDLVIAEAHLRDLLAHAPADLTTEERLGFTGLSKWLESEDCYLRRLGVNAVEIQPVLEFDSLSREEYHWGYMPVSFMAPASAYAGNALDGSAVREFRKLVECFHNAGLAVILDVVYNHVGVPNHLGHLDRELYFTIDELGRLTNHSGCGNDLNCQSEPSRKLVLDSVLHLVRTFDVDGFRFDLGELLGIDLLREIETETRRIKPNLILIAEPWSFRGRLPAEINATGYSLWSDACRERILSYVKEGCLDPRSALDLLQGKLDPENRFPWQSVNYLESHDDHAFVDRLCRAADWKDGKPPAGIEEKARLAIGLALLSPGIPMLAAGQDFMRGKQGVRNTYLRGDLNALDYGQLEHFREFSDWVRSLIAFRLSREGSFLRPSSFGEFEYEELVEGEGFGLLIRRKGESTRLILVNPTGCAIRIPLPEARGEGGARVVWGKCESLPGKVAAFDFQVIELPV